MKTSIAAILLIGALFLLSGCTETINHRMEITKINHYGMSPHGDMLTIDQNGHAIWVRENYSTGEKREKKFTINPRALNELAALMKNGDIFDINQDNFPTCPGASDGAVSSMDINLDHQTVKIECMGRANDKDWCEYSDDTKNLCTIDQMIESLIPPYSTNDQADTNEIELTHDITITESNYLESSYYKVTGIKMDNRGNITWTQTRDRNVVTLATATLSKAKLSALTEKILQSNFFTIKQEDLPTYQGIPRGDGSITTLTVTLDGKTNEVSWTNPDVRDWCLGGYPDAEIICQINREVQRWSPSPW